MKPSEFLTNLKTESTRDAYRRAVNQFLCFVNKVDNHGDRTRKSIDVQLLDKMGEQYCKDMMDGERNAGKDLVAFVAELNKTHHPQGVNQLFYGL